MPVLAARIRRLALEGEARYPGRQGFVDELDKSVEFLKAVPHQFSFTYEHLDRPPEGSTLEEWVTILVHGVRGWLGFLFYSMAWETRHLIDDVTKGLAQSEYLRVFHAARGLMERCALLHDAYLRLSNQAEPLTRDDDGLSVVDVEALVTMLGTCLAFAQATRFNWKAGLKGDDAFYTEPDAENTATNVLTLLDKLPQEEKHAVSWYYKMLCDFVHPNGGSHMLSANRVTVQGVNKLSSFERMAGYRRKAGPSE